MSNIQNDFIMIKVKIMFALWKYLASIMTIVCATGVSRAANQFSSQAIIETAFPLLPFSRKFSGPYPRGWSGRII